MIPSFVRTLLLGLLVLALAGCGSRFGFGEPEVTPTPIPVPTFTPTPADPESSEEASAEAETVAEPEVVVLAATPEPVEEPTEAPAEKVTAEPEEEPADELILLPTPTPEAGDADGEDAAGTEAEAAEEAEPADAPSTDSLLLVDAEAVNVRGGPGTGYAIVGAATQGDEFAITGRNEAGDWWQVCCFADEPGWLYDPLVEVSNQETVAIASDIPELPPTATPEPVAEAQAEAPEEAEAEAPPEAAPVSTEHSGTAGNFDPNAQYQIVNYRVIGYGENNGGIFDNGGQHMIFVNVIDAAGNGVSGAVIKDAVDDKLNVVTGSKGPGRAEFEMFWERYKIYVAEDPSGPVTSQISNQMNTAYPHIPDIIGKLGPADNEYAICPTPDDRCEPPFFHAHWSYEITFQKVK